MHVIKRFIGTDEKTGIVSEIFDECLTAADCHFLSELSFNLDHKDETRLDSGSATIYLNYRNPFIQSMDKKAIRILILRQLLRITLRKDRELPGIVEDILVNRAIIRKGYAEDLFYYYYLVLMEYEAASDEIESFINLNIPWLSFSGMDNYSSETLRKIAERINSKKELQDTTRALFDALKKDLLKNENMEEAVRLWNELRRC